MSLLSVPDIDQLIAGTRYRDPSSRSFPIRLPSEVSGLGGDDALMRVARQAAGVRLQFDTRATRVELLTHTTIWVDENKTEADLPAFISPVIDGQRRPPVAVPISTVRQVGRASPLRDGPAAPVVVELGDNPADKAVVLWLPHRAAVSLHGMRADVPLFPVPPRPHHWAHYGSSISHCFEVDDPLDSWPTALAQHRGWELTHLGLAGQALVDGFVAEALADSGAGLISLEIGTNIVNGDVMRPRAFRSAVHTFLSLLRRHTTADIVVTSPISCPAHEHQPGPTVRLPSGQIAGTRASDPLPHLTMTGARAELAAIVSERRDDRLHYVDGRDLLGPAEAGLLVDGLHPGPAGYALIAQRFGAWCDQLRLAHDQGSEPTTVAPARNSPGAR